MVAAVAIVLPTGPEPGWVGGQHRAWQASVSVECLPGSGGLPQLRQEAFGLGLGAQRPRVRLMADLPPDLVGAPGPGLARPDRPELHVVGLHAAWPSRSRSSHASGRSPRYAARRSGA